jgi:His/Glu/Gln/Arg/opine family amino acid ABC transporter permease subunit
MAPRPDQRQDFPYWLVIVGATIAWLFYEVLASDIYAQTLNTLLRGLWITIYVTVIAFAGASALGLLLALGLVSRVVVLRQAARLYVEVMRGVPIIVLLLYVAFVVAPALVEGWNLLATQFGLDPMRTRDFPLIARAILALILA